MSRRSDRVSAGRRVWVPRIAGLLFALVCTGAVASSFSAGCSGWDPAKPFERNSPEVDEALNLIDSGQFESAEQALSHYLGSGLCTDGGIALSDSAREKHDGTFDLGLVLFHIAEKYGRRFGEEELGDAGENDPQVVQRSLEVDCALIVAKAIASDPKVPVELRARARYLAGNLEFLRGRYEEAVKEYDEALTLVPGIAEDAGGDGIGRDTAWNRAIALRRLLEQKDAGADADADADADSPDADDGEADAPDAPDADDAPDGNDGDADSGDGNDDADSGDSGDKPDAGKDGGEDAGDGAPADGGKDPADAGKQDDKPQEPDPSEPDPKEPPKEPASPDHRQDDRILDRLEEAPSYQEEEAKKRAAGRRRGKMEDK